MEDVQPVISFTRISLSVHMKLEDSWSTKNAGKSMLIWKSVKVGKKL